jgi:CRP-like cAMP-binding protein
VKAAPFNVETFLATVGAGRTVSKLRKNEVVFSQGDPADAVFYLRTGKCKVVVVSEQGKEAVVALHSKGDFFGEGCLNGHSRRVATVTALTDCVIMRLDKAAVIRVIHNEPNFAEAFIAHLLARKRAMKTHQSKRSGVSPLFADDHPFEDTVGGMLRDRYEETVRQAPSGRMLALLLQMTSRRIEFADGAAFVTRQS